MKLSRKDIVEKLDRARKNDIYVCQEIRESVPL